MTIEIESIGGHEVPGDDSCQWFVVSYADGDEEYRQGTLGDARKLASKARLTLVDTPAHSFRWVLNPETWKSPHPTPSTLTTGAFPVRLTGAETS